MCIVCVELIKDKLTAAEARRNLGEMVIGKELDDETQDHVVEVLELIKEKESK